MTLIGQRCSPERFTSRNIKTRPLWGAILQLPNYPLRSVRFLFVSLMTCVGEECKREVTLNYTGGSLTSTRGTLEAVFKQDFLPSACQGDPKEISRKQYQMIRVIGDAATTVPASIFNVTSYPKTPSSFASGGRPIMLFADGAWWTARQSGNIQDLVTFLCANLESLENVLFLQSPSGAKYGPYTPQ